MGTHSIKLFILCMLRYHYYYNTKSLNSSFCSLTFGILRKATRIRIRLTIDMIEPITMNIDLIHAQMPQLPLTVQFTSKMVIRLNTIRMRNGTMTPAMIVFELASPPIFFKTFLKNTSIMPMIMSTTKVCRAKKLAANLACGDSNILHNKEKENINPANLAEQKRRHRLELRRLFLPDIEEKHTRLVLAL